MKIFAFSGWSLYRLMGLGIFCSLTLGNANVPVHAQVAKGEDNMSRALPGATQALTFSGNVYAAGGSARTVGPVDGDLIAAGGSVVVDHPVKEDALLAGGSISVRAPVGDDLRAIGGDLSIDSKISGELFAAAGNINLGKAAHIAKAATLYASNIVIAGRVDGPLKVGAKRVVISGEVYGDATLSADQIELETGAKITGNLHYSPSAELKKAEGAIVGGTTTRDVIAPRARPDAGNRGRPPAAQNDRATWAGSFLSFIALTACATVLLLIAPEFSSQAAESVKRAPGKMFLVGLAALLIIPVLAALLFITILGIPLGLVTLMLYPAMLLLGYLVGAYFLSRRALIAFGREGAPSFVATIGYFSLALFLLAVILHVPLIGPVLLGAIAIIGTGACVIELNRRRQAGEPTIAFAPGTGTFIHT
jgi:cytoskeletal protein CcmA (bactofilin family)